MSFQYRKSSPAKIHQVHLLKFQQPKCTFSRQTASNQLLSTNDSIILTFVTVPVCLKYFQVLSAGICLVSGDHTQKTFLILNILKLAHSKFSYKTHEDDLHHALTTE